MTDEAETTEEEVEVEVETDTTEKGTWIADGELYLFGEPTEIGGHSVFAAAMVAGDAYLGLTSDMKMHKLEIVKGGFSKPGNVTPIKPTTERAAP